MPIKKDNTSTNPEARECAHYGVKEGNHGATLRKFVRGKGADLTPPKITSLASPHRPKASDGSLEPRRREYL